jgi:zinc protease
MPQLKFTDRTLANGMRVLSAPDHSSPTVAIQVWYHVGSKDDPESAAVCASLRTHHVQEHEEHEVGDDGPLTEDVGGFNNAFTLTT